MISKKYIISFFIILNLATTLKIQAASSTSTFHYLSTSCAEGFRYLYNNYLLGRVLSGYAVGNSLGNLLFGGLRFIESRGQLERERVLWGLGVLGVFGYLSSKANWSANDKWTTGSWGFSIASILGFLSTFVEVNDSMTLP